MIQIVFGAEYEAASTVLPFLIWTVAILFVLAPGTNLLFSSHKEIAVNVIYIFGTILNVFLNFILIPRFSFYGAAVSTILSYLVILLIQAIIIRNMGIIHNRKFYFDIIKIVIGSVILGCIFNFFTPNIWIALPIAMVIYFPMIYAFKTLDDNDRHIIKEILGKR